jgi:hypothetical protein
MQGAVKRGVISEREGAQIRASYGAKLSMIDHWFGRVLDALDANTLWDDTLVIVTTDHGHYLGEKDIWGKPGVPIYETIGRIPLMIAAPGQPAGQCDALTTSVDLFATLAELFAVSVRQRTHGRSLMPLLRGETQSVRDHVLAGVWGREVHLITSRYKYARGPQGPNAPLSMLSNRWSTMPTHFLDRSEELPLPDERAVLDRMPGSRVPVIHQTWAEGDAAPYWARTRPVPARLYDLSADPGETEDLSGGASAEGFADQLRAALEAVEAPASQLVRLGLG